MSDLEYTDDGYILQFGRNEGEYLHEVIKNDPGYTYWCATHLDDETTDTIDLVVSEMIAANELPWDYWKIAEAGGKVSE